MARLRPVLSDCCTNCCAKNGQRKCTHAVIAPMVRSICEDLGWFWRLWSIGGGGRLLATFHAFVISCVMVVTPSFLCDQAPRGGDTGTPWRCLDMGGGGKEQATGRPQRSTGSGGVRTTGGGAPRVMAWGGATEHGDTFGDLSGEDPSFYQQIGPGTGHTGHATTANMQEREGCVSQESPLAPRHSRGNQDRMWESLLKGRPLKPLGFEGLGFEGDLAATKLYGWG